MIATRIESTDSDLVAAVRKGDDAAFEELYSRYRPRIASYVRGMVRDEGRAEDLAQEAFLSALRRLRETDSEIAFKPWIYQIARNKAIDHHRRSTRAEEISMDAEHGLRPSDHARLVDAAAPDRALVAKESLEHLCGAFEELSDLQSRVIVMRELEGRSYREIAEQLHTTRPAVEGALFRGRRRLESEYDEISEGRRCDGMRATIARLAEGAGGKADEGRLARHARHCSLCRRRARELGVEPRSTLTRVRSKIAAMLPLPWGLQGGGGPFAGLLGERAAAMAAIAAIGAGGAAIGVEKIGASEAPAGHDRVERRAEPAAYRVLTPARNAPERAARKRAPAPRGQRSRRSGAATPAERSGREVAPAPATAPAPAAPQAAVPAQPSGGAAPQRQAAAPAPAPQPQLPAPPKISPPPLPVVPEVVESLPLPPVQVPPVQLPAPPAGAPGANVVNGVNRALDGVTGTVQSALP